MAARAMSTATVSFGLVSIPVKLYSASKSSASVTLNSIHEKCGGRVRQQFWCPVDEEVVKRDDLVKGYEFAKGQYVLFSDEELKKITARATETIEISGFVPIEAVDPVYFDKPYYLGPNKGGERPYKLLAETMRETGRAAVARYAARGKDYLVLLRPYAEGLVMQQLRFQDELVSFDEVPVGEAEPKPAELELARQLVEQSSLDEFQPEQYKDEVKQRLLEMIEQKIQGQEISEPPAEEPKAQVIDLMEALKASIAKKGEDEQAERKPPKRAAKAGSRKSASSGKG